MGSVSLPAIAAWTAANAGTIAAVGAGASAVAGGFSAYESHEAGVAAANQAKDKARIANDQAVQQQINQRQNLVRSLATQDAQAGAGGIGTGGSFGANALRQITQNQNDLLVTSAGASAQVAAYDQQASSDILTGNIKAGGSLLDAVGTAAKGFASYSQASSKSNNLG